jgi:hypothetical protein
MSELLADFDSNRDTCNCDNQSILNSADQRNAVGSNPISSSGSRDVSEAGNETIRRPLVILFVISEANQASYEAPTCNLHSYLAVNLQR